ncbi:MAG: fibronectin type III domain-containing protein [Acetobacteraceae bacterium]
MAPTGALLGRISLGPGGPEPVVVSTGLGLEAGSLVATGADHATFPVATATSGTDQIVLASNGAPKLLSLTTLQGWLGTGASNATLNLESLPLASSLGSGDLVAVSQNGSAAAISYANLLDGETIDQAAPALPAGDTDTFWVSQGSSTLVRQTFASIWGWADAKLPTYKLPVVELSTSTTLDGTVHNGRILVCSQPITLSPAFVNMGSGFCCEVLNVSVGSVVFGPGITTSTGQSVLPPLQMALVRGATYSGGDVVFAGIVSGTTVVPDPVPGEVTNLTSPSVTTSSMTLTWSAPVTGGEATSYSVQYRLTGTTTWASVLQTGASTTCTISGVSPSTQYDVTVTAINASGVGVTSTILTLTTAAGLAVPGQVMGVSVTVVTANEVSVIWSPPQTGGAASGYTVQFALAGTSTWSTFATGIAGLSAAITGLTPATAYMFQVEALNASGSGIPSAPVTSSTASASSAVTSITWNLNPASSYSVGAGSIGVNVHVNPPAAPVQFGLSHSSTTSPVNWVAGTLVNSDLWGAYVATPTTAGTYYVWCEGTDGSALTACLTSFTVS